MTASAIEPPMNMQPHQQRVLEEKAELNAKLEKLKVFLAGPVFKTLEPAEQMRLIQQCAIMVDYSSVLGKRIAAFK